MNVLITGAKGFLGKNLVVNLKNIKDGKNRCYPELHIDEIYEYDIDSTVEELDYYTSKCDFVFNLAGVNRPKETSEFMKSNFWFTSTLLNLLKKNNNTSPVMISSSIQALLDNDYGKSKKAGEELMFSYSKETGAKVLVYRFPNLFGKWCRPNYNSAIATFCNNIANGLPIQVNNRNTELTLCYVDDVVDELINALLGREHYNGKYCVAVKIYKESLGDIVDLLYLFKKQSYTLVMPRILPGSFAKKLYSTYLSYLPKDKVAVPLNMNSDNRGSFTEILKTIDCGQFSVNISKPGITKGEHWHNTKWEFFVVVFGKGLIQERNVISNEVLEFYVDGDHIQAIHMLPGYTHNIINLSDKDNLVTLMWANEQFDPERPDTFHEDVVRKE